ncbi:MAG: hypothetical protein F6J98_29310 [Moorea sp. SIO4G2]|nr:hypothetical protein [Moorena sp. SIO4G2]
MGSRESGVGSRVWGKFGTLAPIAFCLLLACLLPKCCVGCVIRRACHGFPAVGIGWDPRPVTHHYSCSLFPIPCSLPVPCSLA